jgi:hypothetical protein
MVGFLSQAHEPTENSDEPKILKKGEISREEWLSA